MASKKRKIVKTLYAENMGNPLRIEFTDNVVTRLRELQTIVQKIPVKRGEHALISYAMRKGVVLVRKRDIDIGNWGYEGWDSYMSGEDLKSIDDLPKVCFTSMFLYYLQGGFKGMEDEGKDGYKRLILPKHKELIVWKKIEGTA